MGPLKDPPHPQSPIPTRPLRSSAPLSRQDPFESSWTSRRAVVKIALGPARHDKAMRNVCHSLLQARVVVNEFQATSYQKHSTTLIDST